MSIISAETTTKIVSKVASSAFEIVIKKIRDSVAGGTPDAAYVAMLEEALEEVTEKWKAFEKHECPTMHDLKNDANELKKELRRSTNNKKREMLALAFINRLDPDIYRRGLDKILWSKLTRMEFPHIEFLTRLLKAVKPDGPSQYTGAGAMRPSQMAISTTSPDVEFAVKLAKLDLVTVEHSEKPGILLVSPRGLASEMEAFAWREWTEGYEDEPDKGPSEEKKQKTREPKPTNASDGGE